MQQICLTPLFSVIFQKNIRVKLSKSGMAEKFFLFVKTFFQYFCIQQIPIFW